MLAFFIVYTIVSCGDHIIYIVHSIIPDNQSSLSEDLTNEPVVTEKGKKRTNSKSGQTITRKRSLSSESGNVYSL